MLVVAELGYHGTSETLVVAALGYHGTSETLVVAELGCGLLCLVVGAQGCSLDEDDF